MPNATLWWKPLASETEAVAHGQSSQSVGTHTQMARHHHISSSFVCFQLRGGSFSIFIRSLPCPTPQDSWPHIQSRDPVSAPERSTQTKSRQGVSPPPRSSPFPERFPRNAEHVSGSHLQRRGCRLQPFSCSRCENSPLCGAGPDSQIGRTGNRHFQIVGSRQTVNVKC